MAALTEADREIPPSFYTPKEAHGATTVTALRALIGSKHRAVPSAFESNAFGIG
jgi:hypothetical protein